jgi:ABC-type transport system involved in multi-copper enzyme maturation permease subunit
MFALMKKDWRLNRAPMVGAGVIMLGVYGMTFFYILFTPKESFGYRNIYEPIVKAGTIMMMISCILAACFGGMAFAAERRDRCADFLAMLPVSRLRVVLSKSIVGWKCALAPWLLNAMVIYAILLTAHDQSDVKSIILLAASTVCCLIMCFGLAWLLSAFLESPALSSSISIGFALAFVFLILDAVNYRVITNRQASILMIWINPCIGIVSYIAGTIYYLRRVEP